MLKVLIIEDMRTILDIWRDLLNGKVEMVPDQPTPDPKSAKAMFLQYEKVVDLIVMDACLGGQEINTTDLIQEIRETGYTGPIVGKSNSKTYLQMLAEAGADYTVLNDSQEAVPKKICEILKIEY